MFNILTAIYHDDPIQYGTSCSLAEPQTPAERQMKNELIALGPDAATRLEPRIEALVREQSELAFCRGAQFGSQITLQLLEGFS